MAKRQTNSKKESRSNERGITPGKVAYMYGVSLETFQKWINDSHTLQERMDTERTYLYGSRKWTPKQLQIVFDEFGDPREFKDIIDSNEDKE